LEKEKSYVQSRFNADVLRDVIAAIRELALNVEDELSPTNCSVSHDDGSIWHYETIDEFLADYRKFKGDSHLRIRGNKIDLTVTCAYGHTSVSVVAPRRSEIESIFEIFERHAGEANTEILGSARIRRPTVFIGHGQSPVWRDLKDHLQDKHGIDIEAYETGARAGHTIRDILEDMAVKSSFAVLILTGEDEQADGSLRGRQNVIHEAGLFQGRLGFARAILLLEDGVEPFSNVHGVQYIRFGKNNIKETFGEVLATLRREFPHEG
jgi:predicted nucleotide-binding protein